MSSTGKRWHEFFRSETIIRKMKEVSPDLVTGSYPEAFGRELVMRWGYGDMINLGSLGFVAKVCREDVPEELVTGFGRYFGVGMTPRSTALFDACEQLQEYFENRLLDAQERRGDFAGESVAS